MHYPNNLYMDSERHIKKKYRKRQRKSHFTLALASISRETRALGRELRSLINTKAAIELLIRRNEDLTKVVLETVKQHQKSLDAMKKACDTTDETLCNVLLAIRQNEYLQAWYPATKGYQEMKVTGVHPANLPPVK